MSKANPNPWNSVGFISRSWHYNYVDGIRDHSHNMRAVIWDVSWGGRKEPCVPFFWRSPEPNWVAQSTDLGPNLRFRTNRDEKYCLSTEIESSQVEDHLKNLDFHRISMGIPYVIYIGNPLKNRDPQLWGALSPSSDNVWVQMRSGATIRDKSGWQSMDFGVSPFNLLYLRRQVSVSREILLSNCLKQLVCSKTFKNSNI